MIPNKELSVIIVNYKSEQLLPSCIASVYANLAQQLSVEVIVVNNDVIDGAAVVKSFEKVKVIDHKKNVGFGAAANMGAKAAEGKYLLFLNPDSEICSDNVSEIVALFERNKRLAVVGSKVVSESGAVQEWVSGKEISLYDLVRNNLNFPRSKNIWESKELISVDWVSGTALFAERGAFQEAGGFDEEFFMYFEDMDLCKRLRKKNKEIFYCPTFCVKHLGGKSYSDKTNQKKDYYRSQEHYFKKHRNIIEFGLVRLLRKIFFS